MKVRAYLILSAVFFFGIPSARAEDAKSEPAIDAQAIVSGAAAAVPPPAVAGSPAPPTSALPTSAAGGMGAEEGEYEIDYEEEPGDEADSGDEMPAATPAKGKKSKAAGGGAELLGSRAKHRFTPILKSETKSIYKKDGKALDVDTD